LKPTLHITKLDPTKRGALLGIIPPEFKDDVEKGGEIKRETILKLYAPIKKQVLLDASAFKTKLAMIGEAKPTDEQLNELSNLRSALITSLGLMTIFSGLIQELAQTNTI
jgi:hypothetical protein